MQETTRIGLQAPENTPLILCSAEELLNSVSLETPLNKRENSMPCSHSGSGCNTKCGSMSDDTQPAKGGIREKYSTGNFKSIRKGTICQDGQICGGTSNNYFIRNQNNKRIGRTNISWLSHKFKTHEVNGQFLSTINCGVSLPNAL